MEDTTSFVVYTICLTVIVVALLVWLVAASNYLVTCYRVRRARKERQRQAYADAERW